MKFKEPNLEFKAKDIDNKSFIKEMSNTYLNFKNQLSKALKIVDSPDKKASMFLTVDIDKSGYEEYKFFPAIMSLSSDSKTFFINPAYVVKSIGYNEEKDSFHLLQNYMSRGFPDKQGKICVNSLLTENNPLRLGFSDLSRLVDNIPSGQKVKSDYKYGSGSFADDFTSGDMHFFSARLLTRKLNLSESKPKEFKEPSTYHIHSAPDEYIDGFAILKPGLNPLIKNERLDLYQHHFRDFIDQARFRIY